MRYLVIIENAGNNYSAYVPDLPGVHLHGQDYRRDTAEYPRSD